MRQSAGQAADNTLNQRANSSRQRRAHSQQLIGLHRMLADVAAKHDQKGVAVCMSPAEFNFKVCCRSCFALGQCLPPAGATSSARPMTRLANDSSTFCHTQWIGDRWAGRGVQRLQTQQIRRAADSRQQPHDHPGYGLVTHCYAPACVGHHLPIQRACQAINRPVPE